MNPVSYTLAISLVAFPALTSRLQAAVSVYFYGVNFPNDTNPNPTPLYIGPGSGGMYVASDGGVNLAFGGGFGDPFFYRFDATLMPNARTGNILYYINLLPLREGAVPGDQNYSYLKFGEGYFEPFESIAQFFFDDQGNGRLIAIATTNTGTTASSLRGNSDGRMITVAEGAAAIAAAQVPEASSILLWGLGAVAGVARRRRLQTRSIKS